MHHQTKNAHLSRSSIVQLNGTLTLLCLVIKLIPAEVKFAITVVAREGWLDTCDLTGVTVDYGGNQEGSPHLR